MDEREKFEAWFRYAYGIKSTQHVADLVADAEDLKLKLNSIETEIKRIQEYDMQYIAALHAWTERHNRKA